MPGFDRTGPRGMGPMTGGARGHCNPYGRGAYGRGSIGPWYGRGRGFGRGNRNMSRATGFSGWSRPGTTGAWGMSNFAPYSRDQEVDTLKDQAELLNKELEAINSRIREMESAGQ